MCPYESHPHAVKSACMMVGMADYRLDLTGETPHVYGPGITETNAQAVADAVMAAWVLHISNQSVPTAEVIDNLRASGYSEIVQTAEDDWITLAVHTAGGITDSQLPVAAPSPDDMLTSDDVSAVLRVHRETILQWLREGKIPGSKIGRIWRTRRGDLTAWVTEQSNASRVVVQQAAQRRPAPASAPRKQPSGRRPSF